ncbi:melatonin receptor type 1A-like [Lineus longissimus]|uniref:melatonin receptor type 1A-like n=1 Tax=Lineus longissimus TaxID=88925 RepID=UPI00315C7526
MNLTVNTKLMMVMMNTTVTMSTGTEDNRGNSVTKPFDIFILLVICVSGVIGNILILGAIQVEKALKHNTANAFVCSLAVCDFIITAYIVPFLLANVIQGRDVLEDVSIMCTINSLLVMVTCGLSIYSMAMIALNRYLFICWHTKARSIYTWRNTTIMVVLLWVLIPPLPLVPTLAGWGKQQFNQKTLYCLFDHLNVGYTIYLLVLGIYIPTIAAAICYFKVYRKIRAISIKMQNHRTETNNAASRRTRETRVILMLFTSLMCFLLFWAPYGISAFADIGGHTNRYVLKYSAWLALSNSCLNTVIYGAMNKNFRSGYKKILCFWRKHDAVDNTSSNSMNNGTQRNMQSDQTQSKLTATVETKA